MKNLTTLILSALSFSALSFCLAADVKVTELPAAASLLGTDIFPVVLDPGGTPVTKKSTISLIGPALTSIPPAGITGTAAILGANTFMGAQIMSVNGAASTPAISITGTVFSGGSTTTTKPLLMIQPTGATESWSTGGALLGINANNFGGYSFYVAKAGTPSFSIDGSTQIVSAYVGFSTLYVASTSGYFGMGSGTNGICTYNAGRIGFTSAGSATNASTQDAFFMRGDAAAVIRMGVNAGVPVPQALVAHDATGTNVAAANFTIAGGAATGDGKGGDAITKTSNAAGTGATAQSYSTREFHSAKWVTLNESSATTFATIGVAAGKYVGARLLCTVNATDGTEYQCLTSEVTIDAVAKTTTVTATIQDTPNSAGQAASSGTLTVTYTVTDSGANTVQVKANAVSSLTQTQLRIKWSILSLNTDGADTSLTTGSLVTPQ